jgi:hypothetical protein
MFRIDHGSPRKLWMPIDRTAAATVLYEGQLAKNDITSYNGLAPLAAASGAADTTGHQVIWGVVCGTNYKSPVFAATYGQYATAVASQADQVATVKLGVEGMHPKGDPQPMVEVAKLTASTVLRGDICNATQGTAPTVVTVTSGSTTGAGFTTGAIDFTPVANMNTFYCRSGANKGIYRVSKTTSTTVHTFDTYWPYDVAVGDTFVAVPMRQGQSYVQINETTGYLGTCFSCAASPATNYFLIDVLELDLREAGKETVLFMFNPIHLCEAR